jgi:tripartite-type tricarboxylate transporter receptor subunit TctC
LAGSARSPTLPDVPLLSEIVPGIGSGSWIGLFGPAGLPGDIVERMNREVDRIMRTPEMQERIAASDLSYTAMKPAEFAEFQKAEIRHFAEVIRANGIRIE